MTELFPSPLPVVRAALLVLGLGAALPFIAPAGAQQPGPEARTERVGLPDFTPIMRSQGPAVVNVITVASPGKPPAGTMPQIPDELQEFFRRFMPDVPPPGRRQGMGSGFIISEDGYILTNAHVVADAEQVTVRLADAKRELQARVVGRDPRTDVALLKVEASGLPTVKLGDSSKVEPGQWVAAIGSPFGFANTITAGIVSAIERSIPGEVYVPFIQTDVPVNPGNSGGPLLTMDGEVIGINSMIYSGTGGYMGVSFAIPIEVALEVSKQLQATGKVTRGRIGVAIQSLTRELAEAFGMKEPQGALISSVEPGGPADQAGLMAGDIVTQFNGQAVQDANELPRLVGAVKPGATASIEVWRRGEREQLEVTAGEFPSETIAATAQPAPEEGADTARLGITVSELPPEQRRTLGVDYGLVVRGVQNPEVPLVPGDVIVGVNREAFGSLKEFQELVSREKGETVALLVRRGEATVYVPVQVG
jgi:serine protease Do